MKRVLLALLAAFVVVVAAAPAQAAPLDRQVAALQRQVKSLTKQVTSLKKQVTTLKKQANTTAKCTGNSPPDVCQIAIEGALVAYCDTAITADAFQTTWSAINQHEGQSIFPAPVALSDGNFCNALRVTRQPTLVPPTITPFSQMLARLSQRTTPFSSAFSALDAAWAPAGLAG